MPRPRLPQAKAEASGAIYKNAGRFKDRKTPKRTRPVGEPYISMTPEQQACWHELVGDAPWLHSAHRTLLHVACYLKARLNGGEDLSAAHIGLLNQTLGKLGMTPVDETKVNHGDAEDDDPAEAFFRRPH
jgi:hypothetical protein